MKTFIILAFMLAGVHFASFAQVGIGTDKPEGKLHVSATKADTVAFKVSANGTSALKVASNGGTSMGTSGTAPVNGLRVSGLLQPDDSIKATTKPIYIESTQDSIVLMSGSTRIILSAGGAVRIIAGTTGGITIDGKDGDVNITGRNVTVKAQISATMSGVVTTLQGASTTKVNGGIIMIGEGAAKPAARVGDIITAGSIASGSPTVFIK